MTTLYLVHMDETQASNCLTGREGVKRISEDIAPPLLISFFYIKGWLEHQKDYVYRDWALDSGAFSAYNSGVTIDLQEYIELCLELKKNDPTLTEIFALDVIGDHKASLKNCEKMWEAGVEAIPTYHYNEPEDVLYHIAKVYPKIALGGVARMRGSAKIKFFQQCFARVWPKKIHGFGVATEGILITLPFHSVDASTWQFKPLAFGEWRSFNGARLSVRGSSQNLTSEIRWFLNLEEKARNRWKKEMRILDKL